MREALDHARSSLLGVLFTRLPSSSPGPFPGGAFRNEWGLTTMGGIEPDAHAVAVDVCLEWLAAHARPLKHVAKDGSRHRSSLVSLVREWAERAWPGVRVTNLAFVEAAERAGYVSRWRQYNIGFVRLPPSLRASRSRRETVPTVWPGLIERSLDAVHTAC